jgi:hypothetical protein
MRAAFAPMLLAVALAAAGDAGADICKYADADGNVHYSNLPPEKGWRRLSCTSSDGDSPRRPADGAAARTAPSPSGFPRVDADTQKGRDDVRRKVLGDELAAETKLLAEARTQYADGAPAPLPEERADAEKYRARIARLRQAVAIHEKNIEALKKEIASIR